MNLTLDVDDSLYCYLDFENVAVRWAVARGTLISASELNSPHPNPGRFVSYTIASILTYSNSIKFKNETLIENFRLKHWPEKISRIDGMYFFLSRDSALSISKGGDAWGGHFVEDNLHEVLFRSGQYSIYDSQWISNAPRRSDGLLDESKLEWIPKYFQSEPYNENPIWEVLLNGVVVIPDEKIRRHCYAILEEEFPNSLPSLLMSRLASEVGADGGLISPYFQKTKAGDFHLGYVWQNADFSDKDVIERISKHPDAGLLGKMMYENESWNLPDLRSYFVLIPGT